MYDLPASQQIVTMLVGWGDQCADSIFATVKPEMLQDIDREIFNKCLNEYKNGKEINFFTIGDNPQWIERVTAFTSAIPVYSDYKLKPVIDKLYSVYEKRRLNNLNIALTDMINNGANVEEIWRMFDLVRGEIDFDKSKGFKSLADVIDETATIEDFEGMTHSCLQTNWPDFDNQIIVKPGDMVILAGRPSMGKTDFAMQLAKRVARNGQPVAFFSLETEAKYLNRRLAPGSTFDVFQQFCHENASLPIFIDDNPIQSIYTAKAQLEYAIKRWGVKVAIFDYLTLMDAPKSENRNREIEELAKGLKRNARQLNIPHIVLAQLNRSVEARQNKRPMLSDLRDSGGLEQVVDVALFAYRPSYYGIKETKDIADTANYLEIISGKQRDGARGTLKFYYNPEYKVIENWDYKGSTEPTNGKLDNSVPF